MALITINRTYVVTDDPRQATRPPRRRSGIRRIMIAGVAVVVAGAYAGVSIALADPSPTKVTYTPLSKPHKVISATIAAGKTYSAVVSGAATTVPTGATSVQLTVTAHGTAGGFVATAPTGDDNETSDDRVTYASGGALATGTVRVNIGEADKITLTNHGTGSVVVTGTITGFSTQVTADDISGADGSTGDVLTNDGSTAVWAAPNFVPLTSQAQLVPSDSGSFTAGAALRQALTTGTSSVIELQPGYYSLGSGPIAVRSGVIVIGAGESATHVDWSGDLTLDSDIFESLGLSVSEGSLLMPTGDSTLKYDDFVEGASTPMDAIQVGGSASISDSSLSTFVFGPSGIGLQVAAGGVLDLTNTDFSANWEHSGETGSAISSAGLVEVTNSQVGVGDVGNSTSTPITVQSGGRVDVRASGIYGNGVAASSSGTLHIGGSEVLGIVVRSGSGTATCVSDYDGTFVARPTTC